MDKKLEIGARLKKFAAIKLLSLAELSRLLGMKSPQGLNPYTSGKSILGGELLSKLAELGCDLNWLLNGVTNGGTLINEPSVSYDMTISQTIAENNQLKEELKELKVMIFDLQKENKNLVQQLLEYEVTNNQLLEEVTELKKGLTKGTSN
jgi:transcriptional regulator with XRE-family HTH domain